MNCPRKTNLHSLCKSTLRGFSALLLGVFVMITSTQNGLNLVIYEVAKPYIVEKYCVNRDAPEMHCNGKCHLAAMMKAEEPDQQAPAELPVPEFKYQTVVFLPATEVGQTEPEGLPVLYFATNFRLPSAVKNGIFHPPRIS